MYFEKAAGIVLTPGAAMAEIATLTTPALSAGDYQISYSFELLIATKAKDILWQTIGTFADALPFSLQADSGSQLKNRLYGYPKTWAGGSITLGLQMQCVATACTVNFVDVMVQRIN